MYSSYTFKSPITRQTEHVPLLVLTATLIGNISLNSKVNKSQVLNSIHAGINAPDDAESPALMHVTAELVEAGTKSRKWKIGRAQVTSIQFQAYAAR